MVSALGRSSISGVNEGASTRSGNTSAYKPEVFGKTEGRRIAPTASAIRGGRLNPNRVNSGISEQGAINENFARHGTDLSEGFRGAVENIMHRSRGLFDGMQTSFWTAAIGAAGFFKQHWYDGEHPLGAVS